MKKEMKILNIYYDKFLNIMTLEKELRRCIIFPVGQNEKKEINLLLIPINDENKYDEKNYKVKTGLMFNEVVYESENYNAVNKYSIKNNNQVITEYEYEDIINSYILNFAESSFNTMNNIKENNDKYIY